MGDLNDLARRAVACRGFRWLPGMLAVEQAVPGMALSSRPARVDDYWHEVGIWLPDLTDPATLGCLLALVREAHKDKGAYVYWSEMFQEWIVGFTRGVMRHYDTEAHALVAALEASP